MTSHEKPLGEYLSERKKHYLGRLLARARSIGLTRLENYLAFKTDEAYSSGRIADIEAFERSIDSSKITIGIRFGDLEEVVEQVPAHQSASIEERVSGQEHQQTPSSKPLIDYVTYKDFRDKGATHEEIARAYAFKSGKQEGSFKGNYTRSKNLRLKASEEKAGVIESERESKEPSSGKTPVQSPFTPQPPTTPGLDYSIYVSRRERGNSDEDIRREFSIDYRNRRFIAFRGNYSRWKIGVKKVKAHEEPRPKRRRILPRLTQYQYNQARMKGWNHETIKSRFRDIDEPRLPEFEKHYQEQLQKAIEEITRPSANVEPLQNPKSDYEGGKL